MYRILLKETKAETLLPLCSSKFFGMPDVWDEFEWPAATKKGYRLFDESDCDLDFICQINCAELAEHDKDGILPKTGMLYFFYDSHSGKQSRKYKTEVFYYDGDLSELKPYLPTEGNMLSDIGAEVAIKFEYDVYKGDGKWVSGKRADFSNYLLGVPNVIGQLEFSLPDSQQLLLQLDSYGSALAVCYLIEKSDLVKKIFYAAWTKSIYD